MTPQQGKLYRYLLARIDEPECPSFEEMGAAIGTKSKATIHRLVSSLVSAGYVTRGGRNAARQVRAIRLSPLDGVTSAAMIAELKRRGDLK